MLPWLFEAWKAYAHRAASYQTRVLLTIVYLIVLGPAALIARLLGAHLLDLDTGARSTWLVRANTASDKTLTAVRRQVGNVDRAGGYSREDGELESREPLGQSGQDA